MLNEFNPLVSSPTGKRVVQFERVPIKFGQRFFRFSWLVIKYMYVVMKTRMKYLRQIFDSYVSDSQGSFANRQCQRDERYRTVETERFSEIQLL